MPDEAQNVWKTQKEEHPNMQVIPSANDLAALCRSRVKLNKLVYAGVVVMLTACAISALYNVFRVDQPWLRIGQAWALGALAYLLAPELERGIGRPGVDEPSGRFLIRQHLERSQGYLSLRRRLYLLVPSMVFSWIGVSQVRGLSWPLDPRQLVAVSWPFLATGVGLAVVWLAFGKAADKAVRDAEKVRRLVQA